MEFEFFMRSYRGTLTFGKRGIMNEKIGFSGTFENL